MQDRSYPYLRINLKERWKRRKEKSNRKKDNAGFDTGRSRVVEGVNGSFTTKASMIPLKDVS